MVYVSSGQVLSNKSPWRLSAVPELFWGVINFVVLFVQTLVNPNSSKKGDRYSTDYRVPGNGQGPGGPGGGPKRRMGGFGGRGGGPSAPPMAGGG